MITLHPLDAEQPEALRGETLQRVLRLVDSPRQVKFYQSGLWLHKRGKILSAAHYECVLCAARGHYARATMVHHVWYLTRHPELALAEHYYSGGKAYPQLVPLCHDCHEAIHEHRHAQRREPVTPERW